jgi:hypothetical protein
MNKPIQKPPRYKWPWVLAAAVLLFLVLAVVWVSFAVREVERERGTNPPAPASSK